MGLSNLYTPKEEALCLLAIEEPISNVGLTLPDFVKKNQKVLQMAGKKIPPSLPMSGIILRE